MAQHADPGDQGPVWPGPTLTAPTNPTGLTQLLGQRRGSRQGSPSPATVPSPWLPVRVRDRLTAALSSQLFGK